MTHLDQQIEKFYSLKPSQFSTLVKLELEQILSLEAPPVLSLKIELRSENKQDKHSLILLFIGVQELRLKSLRSLYQILSLKITSIWDRQWEDINYEVKENEDDSLFFFCNNFQTQIQEMSS